LRLDRDFDLPELAQARDTSAPVWHVETRHAIGPGDNAHAPLGPDVVYGDVHVRAFAHGSRFRLAFDDTGTFDITATERRNLWYSGATAPDVAVRADLLGRVIALVAGCVLHAADSALMHDEVRRTEMPPVYAALSCVRSTRLNRVAATFIAWQRSSQDPRAMAAAS